MISYCVMCNFYFLSLLDKIFIFCEAFYEELSILDSTKGGCKQFHYNPVSQKLVLIGENEYNFWILRSKLP